MPEPPLTELRQLSREVLYRGKVFDLIVDQVEYPSGRRGVREIARHPGGAVVVPVLDDGRLLFVRQLRYPLGDHIVEFPAGKLSPGEDPRDCARRELEEETGFRAETVDHLTSIYTTPGFCDEILHIYLGTNISQTGRGPTREEGEFSMTLVTLTLDEAMARIENGTLRDAKTIVGVLLAARRLRP